MIGLQRNTHIWGAVVVAVLGISAVAFAQSADKPRPAATTKAAPRLTEAQLVAMIAKLAPLHQKMVKPQPGDWLESHKEAGQTFRQYIHSDPPLPAGQRRVLYIAPLGEFTANQRKVVAQTAEFMGLSFNLPTKVMADLPATVIPDKARRVHPTWGDKQILSTYVLDKVLKPRLPKDAAACIAFTASDLWPGEGWNFVFGQASLNDRVGVWSIYRNGTVEGTQEEFRLCLLRTMKTATHETGHMFGLQHCTAYECNMCGSNSRPEADHRPIALCPECLAKICWATAADPVQRFEKLAAFFKANGLTKEQEFCEKSVQVLKNP